jgi:TatD DNase family protein
MHIFDTHCHYNLDPLDQSWQDHWQQAQAKGVVGSIVVGTTLETSKLATEIAEQNKNLFCAVGVHPAYVEELASSESSNATLQQTISELEEIITTKTKKIVAIGETGLDYFRLKKADPETNQIKENQKLALIEHIKLAEKHGLPVILHVRDQEIPETHTPGNAYWDVVEITSHFLDVQYILHCVSGPLTYMQEMISRGAYVSVAANVTYNSAHHIRTLVANTPQTRLLLETDAPYLPPQPFRGQMCEPHMISQTAQYLEQEMNINLDQMYDNTFSCFSLLTRPDKTS